MLSRLHLVTDDEVLRREDVAATVAELVRAFPARFTIHVRGHGLDAREFYAVTTRLLESIDPPGTALLVNDRVDIALAAGADGAHLGRRSLPIPAVRVLLGPAALVGYSAHEPEEAAAAARAGADYVFLGTIYPSPSHPRAEARGPRHVRAAAGVCRAPVIAIGGVTPGGVPELLGAGAAGVAVLGGVWHAPDPVAALGDYLAVLG